MHMMSMSFMILSDDEERDVLVLVVDDVCVNLLVMVVEVGENAEDRWERRTVMRVGRNDFMMD